MERFTPNGVGYEIVKDKGWYYSSRILEYTPPGWVKLEDRWYPLGIRLVRPNLTSLRLRRNPTPLQYYIGEWVMLSRKELIAQMVDKGGIFSSVNLSAAGKTEMSCLTRKEDPFQPKIFYAALYNPIAANGYAVKSQGLMLLEEIK